MVLPTGETAATKVRTQDFVDASKPRMPSSKQEPLIALWPQISDRKKHRNGRIQREEEQDDEETDQRLLLDH